MVTDTPEGEESAENRPPFPTKSDTSPTRPPIGLPITFAHRGARASHPENTIPAFRHALDVGVTGLETDVRVMRSLGRPAPVRRIARP